MGGRWGGEIAAAGGEQKHRVFNVLDLGKRGSAALWALGSLPHTVTVVGLLFGKPPSLKRRSGWSSTE